MENEKDLNRLTERAAKVKGMIDSPGWKEIVGLEFESMRDRSVVALMDAKTLEELQKAQATIGAVRELLAVISVVITEGEDANEKLEAMKKKE